MRPIYFREGETELLTTGGINPRRWGPCGEGKISAPTVELKRVWKEERKEENKRWREQ